MKSVQARKGEKVELKYLPGFAGFIVNNHCDEFLKVSLELLRDLQVPLLKPLSDAEGEALANKSNLELLTSLINNNPTDHIQKAIDRWRQNQFPQVNRNQFVVEDVTRIAHARKLIFLKFLPRYTKDIGLAMNIVAEIEHYILEYTATTLQNFVHIIDERINKQLARLEESEGLYKRAESIAHIGNWKWDIDINMVQWTDELYRMFGLDPQSREITFETYLSYVHPEDKDDTLRHINESMETKKPFEFFHRIVLADRSVKIVHSKGETLARPDGTVFQLIGSAQDVTAIKEAESKLLEQQQILLHKTQELQESNASLEEFAFVASHDLKEPLRKISIFVELLQSVREKCSPHETVYFDKIAMAASRMRNLIDDLLSLSVISAEKVTKPTNLKEILEGVLQDLEPRINEVKATINASDLPVASVIPSQFKQLFQNLIDNSLKFVRDKVPSVITISHRYLSPNDVLTQKLLPAEQYLELVFADNGIGFDNSYDEKIFSVFQRLHNKDEYAGTGIGLAICRKIVKNHSGIIRASGAVGQGATFNIILPLTDIGANQGD